MLQVATKQQAEHQILTLKGVTDEVDGDGQDGDGEATVKLHRASSDGLEVDRASGFVFQRCGGGRRIIKRYHGGY